MVQTRSGRDTGVCPEQGTGLPTQSRRRGNGQPRRSASPSHQPVSARSLDEALGPPAFRLTNIPEPWTTYEAQQQDFCRSLRDRLQQVRDGPAATPSVPGQMLVRHGPDAQLTDDELFCAIASVTEAINRAHGNTFALITPSIVVQSRLHNEPQVETLSRGGNTVIYPHVEPPATGQTIGHTSLFIIPPRDPQAESRSMLHLTSSYMPPSRLQVAADEARRLIIQSEWRPITGRPELIGTPTTMTASRQHPVDWACGHYAVLNAWAYALGLRLSGFLMRSPNFLQEAVEIMNLALRGMLDVEALVAFFECHQYVYPNQDIPFERNFGNTVAIRDINALERHAALVRWEEELALVAPALMAFGYPTLSVDDLINAVETRSGVNVRRDLSTLQLIAEGMGEGAFMVANQVLNPEQENFQAQPGGLPELGNGQGQVEVDLQHETEQSLASQPDANSALAYPAPEAVTTLAPPVEETVLSAPVTSSVPSETATPVTNTAETGQQASAQPPTLTLPGLRGTLETWPGFISTLGNSARPSQDVEEPEQVEQVEKVKEVEQIEQNVGNPPEQPPPENVNQVANPPTKPKDIDDSSERDSLFGEPMDIVKG